MEVGLVVDERAGEVGLSSLSLWVSMVVVEERAGEVDLVEEEKGRRGGFTVGNGNGFGSWVAFGW